MHIYQYVTQSTHIHNLLITVSGSAFGKLNEINRLPIHNREIWQQAEELFAHQMHLMNRKYLWKVRIWGLIPRILQIHLIVAKLISPFSLSRIYMASHLIASKSDAWFEHNPPIFELIQNTIANGKIKKKAKKRTKSKENVNFGWKWKETMEKEEVIFNGLQKRIYLHHSSAHTHTQTHERRETPAVKT